MSLLGFLHLFVFFVKKYRFFLCLRRKKDFKSVLIKNNGIIIIKLLKMIKNGCFLIKIYKTSPLRSGIIVISGMLRCDILGKIASENNRKIKCSNCQYLRKGEKK